MHMRNCAACAASQPAPNLLVLKRSFSAPRAGSGRFQARCWVAELPAAPIFRPSVLNKSPHPSGREGRPFGRPAAFQSVRSWNQQLRKNHEVLSRAQLKKFETRSAASKTQVRSLAHAQVTGFDHGLTHCPQVTTSRYKMIQVG